MSIRMAVYRHFQTWVVEPWVLPRWMSEARISEERQQGARDFSFPSKSLGVKRAWFHAASVGELETLIPVMEAWLEAGSEAIVTVLSESARIAVQRLRTQLGPKGALLFAGYSPWEGHWNQTLLGSGIDAFITAKYEAWPELWSSLAERKIPLLIVSAKARRSLRLASKFCKVLGGQVPHLTLLTVRDEDSQELRSLFAGFPQVRIELTGEPRWERVSQRSKEGNLRAKELIQRFASLPRPWGVLAQVWSEDMEVWRGELGQTQGTLWVVPHRVDPEQIGLIEAYLTTTGLYVCRTSAGLAPRNGDARCILVDEMGILLELYSAADWVYVGGGFGVSMHSTIEPALYGLPVACGPNGERKFPEIAELKSTGQLTIVHDRELLEKWLQELRFSADRRRVWKAQADGRLGATQRVLKSILAAIETRQNGERL